MASASAMVLLTSGVGFSRPAVTNLALVSLEALHCKKVGYVSNHNLRVVT